MEKALKFLGVCILLSAIIISAAWVYRTYTDSRTVQRYYVRNTEGLPFVLDTFTGTIYRLTDNTNTSLKYIPYYIPER
jgi:hypothetical protein